MGWEKRSNGRYFYRKKRLGHRVVSEYVGAGEIAGLIAMMAGIEQHERIEQRTTRRQERLEAEALDHDLAQLRSISRTLMTAQLIIAGYHTHKRTWRKERD